MKTTHELAKILLNKPNVPVRHHCIYQDDFQDNPTQIISAVELIGKSVRTIQRWDKKGTFKASRTATGSPYYTEKHLKDYYQED